MASKSALKTFMSSFAAIAIPIIIVAAIAIYVFILGDPQNFAKDIKGNLQPVPVENADGSTNFRHYLALVHFGGVIVPILISLLLIVITFVIERFITINLAKGKSNVANFILKVHGNIATNSIDNAIAECDKQKGSVANVVRAGLLKYREMGDAQDLNRDQKVAAIKQEIEEATSLELPMLEQNLVIIATLASISTLVGLFGTVLGMIKAFSALSASGTPDAAALATGISEALINTALGIGTSALAIIFYNYFTTKIDKMTYSIDEAGVALVQNFLAKHK